jgi:putative flippase GtrA
MAVTRLPFGLNSLVAPTLLGFIVINGGTFAFDLSMLTVLPGVLDVPMPVSVTVAHACAFTLSYLLNFRLHAVVGSQVGSTREWSW